MLDRFFSSQPVAGERATLDGPEAHHLLHVLRAKLGQRVTLFDGSGSEWDAEVVACGRSKVELRVGERQMNALSNLGLLSQFVGMLTDSRSFLSYSRHDYFRRLLCNLLGNDVRRGHLPDDHSLLAPLVKAVSFDNARGYFGFDV